MVKVAECSLCGKYYRTGQIRQVIEKAMGEGNKWVEWRKAVCNNCYKVIIKGEGVVSVGGNGFLTDLVSEPSDLKELVKASEDYPRKLKKERKPRGKRVKSDKSLGTETIEDIAKKIEQIKTVKEEPKKRGRKPKDKSTEASAVSEAVMEASKTVEYVSIVEDKPVQPTAEEVEESIPPLKDKDLAYYKSKVREALESNPEVLYSKIAEKLGIDEGLVSQLVDELELEAAG